VRAGFRRVLSWAPITATGACSAPGFAAVIDGRQSFAGFVQEATSHELASRPSPRTKAEAVGDDDGRGGRIRSPEYRAWIEDAGWRLVSQRPGRVAGPYALLIELPAFTPGDAGNRETAMSDLLQLHNVIDNDSQAQDIRVTRTDGSEFRVTITGLSP